MATTVTPRETAVLNLAAWGLSNKEIADRLSICVKTIETHKAKGMRKLELKSRAQLTRHALRQGWLTTGDQAFEVSASST